ncbi:F-box/kelch-repeat protein At3g23880-like [Chenopodium quinoa]|uniref:F-box domain-containing protein n=1 Tax=Chenopodium quinoa TaxID=63459 RepID=A0A803LMX7_CHEQI|nr:F-box/kelch-repeat protein At3g23880-like [Chenopodium quinoa]
MMNNTSAQKSKHEPTYATLPDHLIQENILIRLKVKPVIRFKCVSKGWFSMISSRKFAKQQFEFQSSLNDQTLIVQEPQRNTEEDKYYLSFDENYNLTEFVGLKEKCLPRSFNPLNTCVVDYCDGLLLMFNEQTMRIYVWNPVTNQCRDTNGPVALDKVDDYQMKCVGFDYVPLIHDYKIGCFMLYMNISVHALMFSFKTGLWTEWALLDDYYETLEIYGDPSVFVDSSKVFVDDTIYWAPKRLSNEGDEEEIFGMDVIAGDMMFVPIVHREHWETAKLFKMNGRLALCLIGNGGNKTVCNVFLMKLTDADDGHTVEIASWERVLSLTYIGADFVYLFETGMCLVSNISLSLSLSLSSQFLRLMLHELSQVSSQEQEQEQPDEGTIVWESVERGNLCRYFSGVALGYCESLFSPFDPYLLQDNQDG